MANPEHLAKLQSGVEEWNAWRRRRRDTPDLKGPNLSAADPGGANLRRANLSEANLSDANLTGANLSGANLTGANLSGANLSGANLSDANLRDANLTGANLSEANLTGADLIGARLDATDLRETDFSHAWFLATIFDDVDLSVAIGLEDAHHYGPSTIGIAAIYKSGGKIPEAFLRGAGVPDNFITYMGSLVGKAIEYYSCFISHSTKDQAFANRLYADLQAKGVRCWFAPHDVSGGRKLHEQIDEAIRVHDKLLLILSEHSMNSEWVKTEIARARKRESQEERQMLFPVRLVEYNVLRDWECFDPDTGKDSAKEIREYFIPDFSKWTDHNCYRPEFDRLVHDLKRGRSGAPH